MKITSLTTLIVASAFVGLTLTPAITRAQDNMGSGHSMMAKQVSNPFKGVEANKGTVSFSLNKGVGTLEVSKDFMVPKSPAPHWQIVDKEGNAYLLKQFRIAGDKVNTKITLPSYIHSVAKVQVWCSFAEVVLGEASFKTPIMIPMMSR